MKRTKVVHKSAFTKITVKILLDRDIIRFYQAEYGVYWKSKINDILRAFMLAEK